MKVVKIYNKVIPFSGFMAMLTLFILWIREEYRNRIDDATINHESIHMYQQLELLVVSIVVGLIIIPVVGLSWWWLFSSLLVPLLIYIICWLLEILLPPYNKAYKNICFESEAQYNEYNFEYLKHRKPFSWIKYISNKKYPYLTRNQRKALWF